MITIRDLKPGDILTTKGQWAYSRDDTQIEYEADIDVEVGDIFLVIDVILSEFVEKDAAVLMCNGHVLTWDEEWSPIHFFLDYANNTPA